MPTQSKPIIESFQMLGIHGYKDISIEFNGTTRIVIAENGAGKTTILSALHAFLNRDFDRFRSISFDSIECKFSKRKQPLILRRSHLTQINDSTYETRIAQWAVFGSVEPQEIKRIILDLNMHARFDYRMHPVLERIYFNSPLSPDEMADEAASIRADLDKALPEELKLLAADIANALDPFKVLYLPTYRRVELPLSRREANRQVRRGARHVTMASRAKWADHGIQFGLADVEERLNEILEQIQRQSNIGYRVISANIIDDLLEGKRMVTELKSAQLPTSADLQLFFGRIQTPGSVDRLAAIRNLYDTGEIENESHEQLRYFLTKLSRVVDQTKELENNIQQFVAKVNDYLMQSSDEKNLVYDSSRMKVIVKNLWTSESVKFDDLSSGEKQVLSILAHLYLNQDKKIILIDEPELSLSMDWQKRLLPDVVNSPTCAQLLAITHSPFIFDNELDPSAGPLGIKRRRNSEK
jgi:predicted ATPase